ncbi:hypothetical protein P154DRAFT_580252 [Amniculicola lignicola CBS 123094]|uniref:Uncharacterized protein n=1 Tax=Amniculicola lignicola CBS 123094 TaxID=1392246 RepID=A0A6A5W2M2_9PLEO|nr:hypothetical protein P154DRAFT_580252 [Amniculicola lignicola CBS 123094]
MSRMRAEDAGEEEVLQWLYGTAKLKDKETESESSSSTKLPRPDSPTLALPNDKDEQDCATTLLSIIQFRLDTINARISSFKRSQKNANENPKSLLPCSRKREEHLQCVIDLLEGHSCELLIHMLAMKDGISERECGELDVPDMVKRYLKEYEDMANVQENNYEATLQRLSPETMRKTVQQLMEMGKVEDGSDGREKTETEKYQDDSY